MDRRTFISGIGLGSLVIAQGGRSQQIQPTYRIALVEAGTPSANQHFVDAFMADTLEAAAGVKQPIMEFARTHPGVRVIDGRFVEIRQAMGTPKGRDAAAAYLRAFVEEMKACGFVADALRRSNQPDAAVAPAAYPCG